LEKIMPDANRIFSRGNWVVHPHYGVGKVQKIKKKKINGNRKKFYRIESDDTIYWVAVESADESPIRKVASRTSLYRALKILKQKPKKMNFNFKARQNRINKVLAKANLRETTKMVRDLWARSQEDQLNNTELNGLQHGMNSLIQELAIAQDVSTTAASSKLKDILDEQIDEPSKQGSARGLCRFRLCSFKHQGLLIKNQSCPP
jgi:RNA polymerase-interacting CarD/CdnL/TRCF family regulator